MMLDRGQDQGWFDSNEIIVEAILSVVGFYFFFADALTSERPFIPLQIFRDWNFSIARDLHVPDRHHPARDDGAGDALSSRT